jgi:hypothetical protein
MPLRLYRELVDGILDVPRFANTIQRMVEVLIWSELRGNKSLEARPTSCRFDASGKVDLGQAAEAAAIAVEGSKPRRLSESVLDIAPTLRARRRKAEMQWHPSPAIMRLIIGDARGKIKLPTFRP